jgi:leukotriene-A4 hydrolase
VGRDRFDDFIQKYIASFPFQSLTTEAFLDFMKAELPDVFEKIDVHTWIYKPGMPDADTWHRPTSPLYDKVGQVLDQYRQGIKPSQEQVRGWYRVQIFSFLQGLPAEIPAEDCPYLEKILELEKANDAAYYSFFYTTCIASGYQAVLPRVQEYLERIGRLIFVRRIFRAMIDTEWSRPYVRPLFERVRDRHHQITVNAIEGLLKRVGL